MSTFEKPQEENMAPDASEKKKPARRGFLGRTARVLGLAAGLTAAGAGAAAGQEARQDLDREGEKIEQSVEAARRAMEEARQKRGQKRAEDSPPAERHAAKPETPPRTAKEEVGKNKNLENLKQSLIRRREQIDRTVRDRDASWAVIFGEAEGLNDAAMDFFLVADDLAGRARQELARAELEAADQKVRPEVAAAAKKRYTDSMKHIDDLRAVARACMAAADRAREEAMRRWDEKEKKLKRVFGLEK